MRPSEALRSLAAAARSMLSTGVEISNWFDLADAALNDVVVRWLGGVPDSVSSGVRLFESCEGSRDCRPIRPQRGFIERRENRESVLTCI